MRTVGRLVCALLLSLAVVFVGDSASWAVDCTATPDDPACVSPSPSPSSTSSPSSEASPSVPSSPSPSATASPSPSGSGTSADPLVVQLSDDDRSLLLGIGLVLGISSVALLVTTWGRD